MHIQLKRRVKGLTFALLILYLAALAYVCFFSEAYGRNIAVEGYRYNLKPFREIYRFYTYRDIVGVKAFILNLFGNIFVFSPFGFMLPVISVKCRGFLKIFQFTFFLSMVIELTQLVCKVGSFDVDDLILNTVGGLIGYAVFKLLDGFRSRHEWGGVRKPID